MAYVRVWVDDSCNSGGPLGQVPPATPPSFPLKVLGSFPGIAGRDDPPAMQGEEVSVVVAGFALWSGEVGPGLWMH